METKEDLDERRGDEVAGPPEAPDGARDEESPDDAKRRPLYRRPVFLAIVGVVLLVGVGWGVRAFLYARSHESTDDAFIDGTIIQINPKVSANVARLYVSDNQEVNKGDLLVELDAADLQARLDQARAALAEAEARERAASANVRLTRRSTAASVRQATAGVEAARAELSGAGEGVSTAQGRAGQASAAVTSAAHAVEQARAQLAQYEAEAARATRDVDRYRPLVAKDEVSRQQFDQIVANARTANAQVEAGRARVGVAEAQLAEARAAETAARGTVGEAQSKVAGARATIGEAQGRLQEANTAPEQIAVSETQVATVGATIEQARAAVEQAELQLSYTKIYAPDDGKVTKKSVDVGQLVQVGQPLMAIVTGDLWIAANFKETQLDEIRPGQPVEIKIDAYPSARFHGHVDSIQAGSGAAFSVLPAENATGNYVKVVQRVPVKIVFDSPPDPQYAIGPGMSVEPEVEVR